MDKNHTNSTADHYYCDEVQDILGQIPSWLVRSGSCIMALIGIVLIIICCIIKYPQTISASITISSSFPPAHLASKYTGQVDTVFVSDGQQVLSGDIIAIFSNTAEYNDVDKVRSYVEQNHAMGINDCYSSSIFDEHLSLGDLETIWSELSAIISEYHYYIRINESDRNIMKVANQIRYSEQQMIELENQKNILQKDLELQENAFRRDSILFMKGLLSEYEFELGQQAYLSKLNSMLNFEVTMLTAHYNLHELNQSVVDIEVKRNNDENQFDLKFRKLMQQISAQLKGWYDTYSIVTPIDGTVSLHNFWGKGQHISSGDIIASVVPGSYGKIEGRIDVSSAGFGQIVTGQKVNVKLNGFSYLEYGTIAGIVEYVSNVPEKTSNSNIFYRVVVAFPDGMKSSYGKCIPLVQEMDGSAEIIVNDVRLINHFIRPIKAII